MTEIDPVNERTTVRRVQVAISDLTAVLRHSGALTTDSNVCERWIRSFRSLCHPYSEVWVVEVALLDQIEEGRLDKVDRDNTERHAAQTVDWLLGKELRHVRCLAECLLRNAYFAVDELCTKCA